ncbi:UNVERIFIED_CONTAM: hypothetical protein K2H54_047985 [Gekko kuhli]
MFEAMYICIAYRNDLGAGMDWVVAVAEALARGDFWGGTQPLPRPLGHLHERGGPPPGFGCRPAHLSPENSPLEQGAGLFACLLILFAPSVTVYLNLRRSHTAHAQEVSAAGNFHRSASFFSCC